MTRREKHNIESNCVTFNDDCYDETVSHVDTHSTVEDAKHNLTGDQFVKYLEEKLAVSTIISAGTTSTKAIAGSTEEQQF